MVANKCHINYLMRLVGIKADFDYQEELRPDSFLRGDCSPAPFSGGTAGWFPSQEVLEASSLLRGDWRLAFFSGGSLA